jgi:hypothetical protein
MELRDLGQWACGLRLQVPDFATPVPTRRLRIRRPTTVITSRPAQAPEHGADSVEQRAQLGQSRAFQDHR